MLHGYWERVRSVKLINSIINLLLNDWDLPLLEPSTVLTLRKLTSSGRDNVRSRNQVLVSSAESSSLLSLLTRAEKRSCMMLPNSFLQMVIEGKRRLPLSLMVTCSTPTELNLKPSYLKVSFPGLIFLDSVQRLENEERGQAHRHASLD